MCASLEAGAFKLTYIADMDKDCSRKLNLPAIVKAIKIAMQCRQNIVNTVYIVCALTYSIQSIQKIKKERITDKIKSLVCYNSSNVPECFIAAVCREKGIKTFSLQHGFYYQFKSPPPLAVINYENVVADELLVWSEFCKEQIESFYESENRACDFSMPIAGYFKSGSAKPCAAQKAAHPTGKHILCLLPGPDDLEASIALLNLLKNLPQDHRITVRMHPLITHLEAVTKALPEQTELDTNRLLADTLAHNQFSIAVGFNSTSLLEALLADIYCATFSSAANNFPDMPIDEFSCTDELESLIRRNQEHSPNGDKNYLLGSDTFQYEALIIPHANK
ncbi:hypothetical protein DNK34_22135 [Pseudomonas dryadis]|uniref:Uncharacterized protein n=2 Tax=Pseudomonadales TaxID=72274 RepID=A0A4Q9QVN3_9GAMM|nr:hypothetical protein DNK44_19250 [Pseudomonas dryadis]TBV00994.1 hypothetical protein DNK34_22135 [Pseudomonas dryadis]TBV20054.1 hypothetical protein DNK41_01040 [Pseudomonas sp. FRB 230]